MTPQAGPADWIAGHRSLRRATFYPKTDAPLPDELLRSLRNARPPEDLRPIEEVCFVHVGKRPIRVVPLAHQGTFHQLFRAEMPDGTNWIVRTNLLSSITHDLDLHVDAWAYRVLSERGLPSLRVLDVDTSRERVDFDYEILEEASGESLRVFDEDDSLILPRLADLGRFLAKVHAIPTNGFGWIDPGPLLDDRAANPSGLFASWGDYLGLRLDEHVGICVEHAIITADVGVEISSRLAQHPDVAQPALLHGDLGNHNVFHDQTRGISAVIDWEDCLSGDPVFDLAFWATFHPERRWGTLLSAYWSVSGRAQPVDFERRFWLYYLRISLSKTVHRLRFSYQDRPGRPPASSRILRALQALA